MDVVARLLSVATWPASRFAGLQRTYDLTLPAWDVTALVEAGVAVDPLHLPVGEALRSPESQIVGRVAGQRFEIDISGQSASGLGLVGTVEERPPGVATLDPGLELWLSVALGTMMGAAQSWNLLSHARTAQAEELPILVARLDALLAPHLRSSRSEP